MTWTTLHKGGPRPAARRRGADHLSVGQRASVEGHVTCGRCRNCRAGRRHLCIRTSSIGVNRDGAFADYVVVPARNVWPQSESASSRRGPPPRPVR